MSTSNMPARLRIGAVGGPTTYYRADIVERLAEAASKFVAVCSDKRGEWTGRMFIDGLSLMDSFAETRSALNSYREASNDKA